MSQQSQSIENIGLNSRHNNKDLLRQQQQLIRRMLRHQENVQQSMLNSKKWVPKSYARDKRGSRLFQSLGLSMAWERESMHQFWLVSTGKPNTSNCSYRDLKRESKIRIAICHLCWSQTQLASQMLARHLVRRNQSWLKERIGISVMLVRWSLESLLSTLVWDFRCWLKTRRSSLESS